MGEELREQCRRGAQQVLADRGWELVQDEAAFVEEVLAEVKARLEKSRLPLEKIIEHATINRYCHLWYEACKTGGGLRRRRALRELHRYMYQVALYCAGHDQHLAEESAQEALISAWRHLDQVADPGSFAAWSRMIVSREVKAQFEKRARKTEEAEGEEPRWQFREVAETDLSIRGGSEDVGAAASGIGGWPDAFAGQESKMTDEMQARIEAAIQHCLDNEQQREVIIGLFLDEASGKEVADVLHTTPGYVYVLKHRALEYLRKCEEFLEVLEALL